MSELFLVLPRILYVWQYYILRIIILDDKTARAGMGTFFCAVESRFYGPSHAMCSRENFVLDAEEPGGFLERRRLSVTGSAAIYQPTGNDYLF